MRADYRLGPIGEGTEGTPPSEVLDACNRNNSAVIGTSDWAHAKLTITYSRGVVHATVLVTMVRGMATETGVEAFTAIPVLNHDGVWDCAGNSQESAGSAQFTFGPGQSTSYDLWFLLLNARTNTQPSISQHTLDQVTLGLDIQVDQIGPAGTSRSHAAHTPRYAKNPAIR